MKIDFSEPNLSKTATLVLGVPAGNRLGSTAISLDKATGGGITRAIRLGHFEGKRTQLLQIPVPATAPVDQIFLVGLGEAKGLSESDFQDLGGEIYGHLNAAREEQATFGVDALVGCKVKPGEIAAHAAYGAQLASYRFDKYWQQKKTKNKAPTLKGLSFQLKGAAQARRCYAPLEKVGEGVFFTRDLVSEPSNILYPETLAKEATKLRRLGVKVDVLDEKAMEKLGMGALLGVAQGSARKPRLVALSWQGAKRAKDKRPLALVGKGVTFDSGGISIKPSAHMEDMKWDMGGSAVVLGVFRALAARKAKVNVVGVIGLTENMPSGTAQRPGDVVTSMSGQTIEVINTDAEGRLVLADALWYCQERFKPKAIVDLATLTGAIIVALGMEYAGLLANNDALATKLAAAGEKEGERLWRLPLDKAYDKDIDSPIADMKNVGSGRGAGSITAAQFLQRFVQDVPWAHIDIAGVTWANCSKPTVPKGGTGFGVRLLHRFVTDNYEEK